MAIFRLASQEWGPCFARIKGLGSCGLAASGTTFKRRRQDRLIFLMFLTVSLSLFNARPGFSQLQEVEPNDSFDMRQIINLENSPVITVEGSLHGLGVNRDGADYFEFSGIEGKGFDSWIAVVESSMDTKMATFDGDCIQDKWVDNGSSGGNERIFGMIEETSLVLGVTANALNETHLFCPDSRDHQASGSYSLRFELANRPLEPALQQLNLIKTIRSGAVDALTINPSNGHLFSVDASLDFWQVSEFAPDGSVVSSFDDSGLRDEILGPIGVTYLPNGNLLMADRLNRTVREITSEGDIVKDGISFSTGEESAVSGLVIAPDSEHFWGLDQSEFSLRKFNLAGEEVSKLDYSHVLIEELDFAQGVAIHPSTGNFWIVGQNSTETSDSLLQITPSLQVVSRIDLKENYGFDGAEGVAIDPTTNQIYVGFEEAATIAVFQLPSGVVGDFDGNGVLNAADIDMLTVELLEGERQNDWFDANADGDVDEIDRTAWVAELANTFSGDANLDGEFNSGDLVHVFQSGKFELDVNASWAEGDWNGDRRFDSSDLVLAFQDGGYELGPRALSQSVPEPTSSVLIILAFATMLRVRRNF